MEPLQPFARDPSLPAATVSANPFRPASGMKPLLRFGTITPDGRWVGSLLLLIGLNDPIPTVTLHASGNAVDATGAGRTHQITQGGVIYAFGGTSFVRYDIFIELQQEDQAVQYEVSGVRYTFHVPARGTSGRIAFWSCNGFGSDAKREDVEGTFHNIQPMWTDLLREHARSPFHVQIGGGDQIYADSWVHDLWADVPLLGEWLQTDDIYERRHVQWTAEHERTIADFYYQAYVYHFQEDKFSDAMSTIPYVYMCDDHDLTDGYGSYPPAIMSSPLMMGIGRIAYDFYLLFQHHTTIALAQKPPLVKGDDLFPAPEGFTWIRSVGGPTLVLGIDNRSKRTEHEVVPANCWAAIWARLDSALAANPATKHLLVLATVPVVYPRLTAMDHMIEATASIQKRLRGALRHVAKAGEKIGVQVPQRHLAGVGETKAGMFLVGTMGQPNLRDDLVDEWTHPFHIAERGAMVARLQALARERGVRVTFLGGDVHVGGLFRFRAENAGGDGEWEDRDPLTMYQVVASPIGNTPPPHGIVKVIHATNKAVLSSDKTGLPGTVEEFLETFKEDVDGSPLKERWLIDRRNWAAMTTQGDGAILVELHVEQIDKAAESKIYPRRIPLLRMESGP
ncbi:hypothetical protein HK101_002868 [Irineochytrium annulatum]|nr:hypothetical protein HK101_002868 [Irineochytrium annulatum]